MPATKEHFSIHASVVFQLGENLVTDSTQALLELIKNSYDADASFCKVSIDSSVTTSSGTGQIVVEDDGTGMDQHTIQRGWLTISDSTKKEFKRHSLITKKGRTPLGDKGLGRLGTQRLGWTLEIVTTTGDHWEHKVDIDWNEFSTNKPLELVEVAYERNKTSATHGTRLIISGLRDLETWKASQRDKLRETLSQVISPYKEVRDFEVLVKVDGENLDLYELSNKLRDAALIRYNLSFEKDVFEVEGRIKLAYVRPDKGKKEKLLFDDLVSKDDGREFFRFIKEQKGEKEFGFNRLEGKWFVGFKATRGLEDFDGLDKADSVVANPGPFKGEIDYFGLGAEAIAAQTIFSDTSQYRNLIDALSGIRVFRDGFGIRLAHDWLQLGEQWTSAPSYYGLKPQNTMGYIAISAVHNQVLQEKTDREGFLDDPHYRNFREILRWLVAFVGKAQEFLRRGWNEFKRFKNQQQLNLSQTATPEDVSASLQQTLSRSANYRLALSKASFSLTNSVPKAERLGKLRTKKFLAEEDLTEIRAFVADIESAIANARKVISEVDSYLQELGIAEKHAEVISHQVETLREQIRETHETIALGLTAEALSHEIGTITSSMAERNDQVLRYLRSGEQRDAKLLSYAEHVKGAVAELRRELSYMAPALRYVREKREEIELYELLADMYKHHLRRFTSERISLRLRGDPNRDFVVKVNRGKIVQIFDNFFLNSEYWLKEDLRLNRISQGIIEVELKRPWVWVSDNGRGIDPIIEDQIFEPFVSAKGKGRGRGLGLFIVKQLLESENCSAQLLEERNRFDRRVKFEIELRGMLSD